jgi:hypothetical protein
LKSLWYFDFLMLHPSCNPSNAGWSNEEGVEMKRLLNLKEWLTLADAIRHLSILFGEDISEADVLRLALDGHLTLSVYFVNGAACLRGPLVSTQDAKRDTKSLDEHGRHPIEGEIIDEDHVIECGNEVDYANGVWDLSMLGCERAEIDSKYQALTNGPAVDSPWWVGPVLRRQDGTHCQIVTRLLDNEIKGKILVKPYTNRANYRLAQGLPADSVIVVRTSVLNDFEGRLSMPYQGLDRPIEQRERRTLLLIIAALAKLAKIDVTRPSSAAATITSQTALMGADLAARTVENHLNRISDAMESRRG